MKFIRPQDSNFKLCVEFFREFKNEDLIWITNLWIEDQQRSQSDYLNFLNRIRNFDDIKDLLEKEFEKTGKENLEKFINYCYRRKIRHHPPEHLNFLSNNNRLCWLLINHIENKTSYLKFMKYPYRNIYFSLIYIIQKKSAERKIKLEELRELNRFISDKKNPKHILKTYINDKDFIDWALSYTESQHLIDTNPRFQPISINEKFEKFYGYWDCYYSDNEDQYIHDITLLKKAWLQKKTRETDNLKKSNNLSLTKKSRTKLKALAEKINISETKVLEKLIEDAYKNEMLDEKGKALY